jgi:hypothetical protein
MAVGLIVGLAASGTVVYLLRPRLTEDARRYSRFFEIRRLGKPTRLPWPEYPGGEIQLDEPCVHMRRPWSVPKEKPNDVPRRTLVLGDSHIDGVCRTRENLTAVLDAETSPSQVVNCGIFGWSPIDALRYYRDELSDQQFTDVVYVFYAGNDLSDLFRPGLWQATRNPDGTIGEIKTPRPEDPPRWAKTVARWGFDPGSRVSPSQRRALLCRKMWEVNPGCVDQVFFQALYFQDNPEQVEPGIAAAVDTVTSMQSLARQRGARFVLVLLPTKQMVEPESITDLIPKARRILRLKPELVHLDERVYQGILRGATAAGITVIGLLPDLVAAHKRRPAVPMFWRTDFHLSSFGHAAVADALRDTIAGPGMPATAPGPPR